MRLKVLANSPDQAFSLRSRLRKEWEELLVPVLEHECDEVNSDGQVIHLRKIDVTVKVPVNEQLLEQLPLLVRQQFKEQLRAGIERQESTQANTTSGQISAIEESRFTTLTHYLQTGLIPWHTSHQSISHLLTDLQTTAEENLTQLADNLLRLHPNPLTLFRLLQLLSLHTSMDFIHALSAQVPWGVAMVEIMNGFLSASTDINAHLLRLCAAEFLYANIARDKTLGPPDLKDIVEKIAGPGETSHISSIMSVLPAQALAVFQQQTRSPENPSISDLSIPNPPIGTSYSSRFPDDDVRSAALPADVMRASTTAQHPEPETSRSRSLADDLFPFMIHYAGLVLLHPFLVKLFEATGVKMPQEKQIAPKDLPRAAALLHFLATGIDEVYEFELIFIKILLGLSPAQSLPVSRGLLSNEVKEEAHTVLQATVTHWSVLKNTSIEGLRSSFLSRQGLLRDEEHGWHLQVEPHSYDLLLHHLPWSISIVRLPWMHKPLHTEWGTP